MMMEPKEVLHLDAVEGTYEGVTVFRTEEPAGHLAPGDVVGLQQWWAPWAYDAVVDIDRSWAHRPPPAPGHHEHCLLDWATIQATDGASGGWESRGEWICEACYERYLIDDHLGLRGR
jgi:hypothetical protein